VEGVVMDQFFHGVSTIKEELKYSSNFAIFAIPTK